MTLLGWLGIAAALTGAAVITGVGYVLARANPRE